MIKWQYLIILLVIFNFILYLIRTRRSKGIVLDLWGLNHLTSWLWYFMIYPFADSFLNEVVVGQKAMSSIEKGLDTAFYVVCVGYIMLWVGKIFYDCIHNPKDDGRLVEIERITYGVYSDKKSRIVFAILFAPFILYTIYFGIFHFGSDIRMLLGVSPVLRPIMNMTMSIYPVIVTVLLLLYLQEQKKKWLYWGVGSILFSLFLSSRAVVFSTIVNAFVLFSIYQGRKISMLKVGGFGVLAIIGIFGLSFLRAGNISNFNIYSMFYDLMYGNTFSDIRDFAWVIGSWDHNLLYGKTYMAGLLSFIPSAISDFRQEWAMGRFTLHTTGMYSESTFHGGLRCTIFGEPYFNFGIVGVMIIAFIYGYYTERINRNVIFYSKRGLFLKASAASTLGRILGCMMISAGAFNIYLFFIPILFIYWILKPNMLFIHLRERIILSRNMLIKIVRTGREAF